jgi:hypothetical protein
MVANETEQLVSTTASFDKDEVCVYIVTKNQTYEHLTVSFEAVV